jgi:hypothetical protein
VVKKVGDKLLRAAPNVDSDVDASLRTERNAMMEWRRRAFTQIHGFKAVTLLHATTHRCALVTSLTTQYDYWLRCLVAQASEREAFDTSNMTAAATILVSALEVAA